MGIFGAGRSGDGPGWRRMLVPVVALLAGAVVSVPGGGSPGAVPSITEAPDGASAVYAAHRQGSRVEVADQRTATRTIFANPDGTMTAELSAVPMRVRRDGRWLDIDTTLARGTDGAVR